MTKDAAGVFRTTLLVVRGAHSCGVCSRFRRLHGPRRGAIVGSATFNILVIPALSAFANETLGSARNLVHRDTQFYVISVLIIFVVFALGATYIPGGTNTAAILTPALMVLPLATYLIYLFLHQQDASDYVGE